LTPHAKYNFYAKKLCMYSVTDTAYTKNHVHISNFFRQLEAEFQMALARESGVRWDCLMRKNFVALSLLSNAK
jgi:hypothetical protein